MTRKHRIKWLVVPKELPAVLRRCPKCGKKTEYENNGKFRVNANGSLLDIWLIYRCESCETSWNMAVYERIAAKDLDSGKYMGFLSNDAALAARIWQQPGSICSKQGGAGGACGGIHGPGN